MQYSPFFWQDKHFQTCELCSVCFACLRTKGTSKILCAFRKQGHWKDRSPEMITGCICSQKVKTEASQASFWAWRTECVLCAISAGPLHPVASIDTKSGAPVGQRLLVAGVVVAVLLVYQLLTALAGEIWSLTHAVKIAIMCFALLLLISALAALIFQVGGLRSKPARYSSTMTSAETQQTLSYHLSKFCGDCKER